MCLCNTLNKIMKPFVNKIAVRYYAQRQKKSQQEDDWIKAEAEVKRSLAGLLYLFAGALLIIKVPLVSENIIKLIGWLIKLIGKIPSNQEVYVWCIGWSAIGLGAGLINTRNHQYGNWYTQHLGYCGFVLIVISTLAYTLPLYFNNNLASPGDKYYLFSMLIGLIGGFLGDSLHSIAERFVGKK